MFKSLVTEVVRLTNKIANEKNQYACTMCYDTGIYGHANEDDYTLEACQCQR